MSFANPLSAGPNVTSPATLIDQGNVAVPGGGLILPQGAVPGISGYDVSAYTGIIYNLTASSQGMTVIATDQDALGHFVEPNLAGGVAQIPNTGIITLYQRSLGPYAYLSVTPTAGGGSLQYAVYGTSQVFPHDGPYSPGFAGLNLGQINGALGIGGTATQNLFMTQGVGTFSYYAGPAELTMFGVSGGPLAAYVRTKSPALNNVPVAGGVATVPPSGSLGIGSWLTVPFWMPAADCELVVLNGGTGQNVIATVITTG